MAAREKPHFKVIDGRPQPVEPARESPVEAARRRFGKPFCFEPGSTYTLPKTPILQDWMAKRKG